GRPGSQGIRRVARRGAGTIARRIPRSDRPARCTRSLVPGDQRGNRSAGGNRDVAATPRATAPAAHAGPWRENGRAGHMTETEFERRLSAAIREEMPPLHAPEDLRQRVRAAINSAATPTRWERWGYSKTTRWLAVAASLALVAVGGTVGYQLAERRAGEG